MNDSDLATFITAAEADRRDLFNEAALRFGTNASFIEKDFWVCWTLEALFNKLPKGGPRLLFKGGTSLSKAWGGLIHRFSEDIDVSVFREDIDQPVTVAELSKLGRNARKRKLDDIRDACRSYVLGDLRAKLAAAAADLALGPLALQIYAAPPEDDPDGQTLRIVYPTLFAEHAYVRPWVKLESGARSEHHPSDEVIVKPYVMDVMDGLDLSVSGIRTIRPERTFWDKIRILHEQRSFFEEKGVTYRDGLGISRHYYDVHRLSQTECRDALEDEDLMRSCIDHGSVFFHRKEHRLDLAKPGTFQIVPEREMAEVVARDYARTREMIFGEQPSWEDILDTLRSIEGVLNGVMPPRP